MKRICLVALAAILAALVLTACSSSAPSAISHDANNINARLSVLERAEPIAEPLDSADRRTQDYFYTAEADPNKIWYLETLSLSGSVEATYTIRGPVVPASDQVTNPTQQICHGGSNGDANCDALGLAEPNGTYAGNTDDHLAVLSSGALLRFEGNYQVSDQPFTVKTPETLTINSSAPISATDLTKTRRGILPPKG